MLYVHVRGKIVTVSVGSGRQFVYWLATTSVQRYLEAPLSYTSPFSQELTPSRVLARLRLPTRTASAAPMPPPPSPGAATRPRPPPVKTDERLAAALGDDHMDDPDGDYYWAYLNNDDRLCECGLQEADHVWIDVGDGSFLSQVRSRTLRAPPSDVDAEQRRPDSRAVQPPLSLEKCIINATADPLAITGEQALLPADCREPDVRPTLKYYQVHHAPRVVPYRRWEKTLNERRRLAMPQPPGESPIAGETPEIVEAGGGAGAEGAASEGGDEGGSGAAGQRPSSRSSSQRKGSADNKKGAAKDEAPWTHTIDNDAFRDMFKGLDLDDMKDSKAWSTDVQAVLWRNLDPLVYVMYYHDGVRSAASKGAAEGGGKGAAEGKTGGELGTISMLELRNFCRRSALTSPYLSLAQIDLLVPAHDGNDRRASIHNVHDAEGRVSLSELMETLVRIAVARQANRDNPAVPLPDCLVDILESQICPAYVGTDVSLMSEEEALLASLSPQYSPSLGLGAYRIIPHEDLSGGVRRMLRIHAAMTRTLFARYAQRDETRSAMHIHEWLSLCAAARLGAPSASAPKHTALSNDDLVRLFAVVALGGEVAGATDPDAVQLWRAKHEQPPPTGDGGGGLGGGRVSSAMLASATKSVAGALMLCEFEELLARLALAKFDHDRVTPEAIKVHEILQQSCSALTVGGTRPRGVPAGYLLNTLSPASPIFSKGGPTSAEALYSAISEPFEPRMVITSSQAKLEAQANADRVRAVDMLLNKDKYEAMAAAKDAKGDKGKGGDKKGGKKKK
jgi:hypothetical protein